MQDFALQDLVRFSLRRITVRLWTDSQFNHV